MKLLSLAQKKLGFTLLELLVVISIIGILIAIGVASFSTAQRQGRDARRRADMKAVQAALEQCYALDGVYTGTNCAVVSSAASISVNVGTGTELRTTRTNSPTGAGYSISRAAQAYCVCAALDPADPGRGNANGAAAATCPIQSGTPANDWDWFCVTSQQ